MLFDFDTRFFIIIKKTKKKLQKCRKKFNRFLTILAAMSQRVPRNRSNWPPSLFHVQYQWCADVDILRDLGILKRLNCNSNWFNLKLLTGSCGTQLMQNKLFWYILAYSGYLKSSAKVNKTTRNLKHSNIMILKVIQI